ncbi:MAG: MOSC domain-containing protein [Planctomycetota bacterium]|jgi:MOSC domain-containing protein YiiM
MSSGEPAGRVVAVCLGDGGVPKFPVESARVETLGLVGDRHRLRFHGGENRAVCLLAVEQVRALEADGVRSDGPGTFGENLLIEGLPPEDLRPGDRLKVGDEVLLEIWDVREPCKTLKPIDERFPTLMLGRSGWLARVIEGGEVRPGQQIRR